MSDITRKLATIRKIDTISPIEGADLIEVASVGGWNVVTKRGEFKAGDLAVYFEIDSFLKEGNPAWQFLVDKSSRMFDGERGHVLRTVKLRGVYSHYHLIQHVHILNLSCLMVWMCLHLWVLSSTSALIYLHN